MTITGTPKIEAGTTEKFTTSVTDPTGLTFTWDYGDGTTAQGPTQEHLYATAGNYHVTLTVANTGGDSVSSAYDFQAAHYTNVADLLCSKADSTGWCWQDTRVTGQALTAAQFMPSSPAGWVIGKEGTLLRTTDSGDTWTEHSVNAVDDLVALNFQDQFNGVVLRRSGSMTHSIDGGKTWTELASPLPGVQFVDPSIPANDGTKIVVTDDTSTEVSTDAGVSWTTIAMSQAFTAAADCWSFRGAVQKSAGCTGAPAAQSVGAADGTVFFAGGSFGPKGTHVVILGQATGLGAQSFVTFDGGATWGTPTAVPMKQGGKMRLVDATHAFYLDASSFAFLSSDGGVNWAPAAVPPEAGADFRAGLVENGGTLYYAWQGGLSFATDFAGAFTSPPLPSPEPATLPRDVQDLRVYIWDGAAHAVVSFDGRFYVTHDRGVTWTQVLGPDVLGLWSAGGIPPAIAFGDAKHGALVMSSGLVQATADGGRTWTRNAITVSTSSAVSVAYASAANAWMTLDGHLWASSDSGATWAIAQSASTIIGALQTAWPDADHGWTATADGLYSSHDTGATWQAVSLGSTFVSGSDHVTSIAFESATAGVVSLARDGATRVLRTNDGGVTWTQTGSVAITETAVRTGAADFWLNGAAPYHSADHGATWQVVTLPAGSASIRIFGGAGSTVFACDNLGRVFTSADVGKTWKDLTMGPDIIVGAGFALDPLTVWTVTQDGTVLATATAGL